MKEWYRQKAVQGYQFNHSPLDLGFSTLFLNRTNRSGILTGGVIGGKEQSGEWKLSARFNKRDIIERISRIASYSPRIKIYNTDAIDFLQNECPTMSSHSFLYLDPPYYV